MLDFFNPTRILYMIPAVVIGLSFHEYAHAAMAYRLGDRTAYHQGRLTVNPAAHIDILGLILLFVAGFGWAKPVPVNFYNISGDKKRGMFMISLAGPATNLVIAFVAAVLLGAFFSKVPYLNGIVYYIITINAGLAVFNLLPFPPLDGSKILAGLLPGRQEWLYNLEQYGVIILVLLLATGLLGKVLGFFLRPLYDLLFWLVSASRALF
ncbi:MAG: site-2 protease family protein [Bacillota bacterium]